MKYHPGFPERFGSIEVDMTFSRPFFDWYNHTHRHSGIRLMTPGAVHTGRADALHAERVRACWRPHSRRIPNVSCGACRFRPRFPPPPGSTGPAHRRLLANYCRRLSHSP